MATSRQPRVSVAIPVYNGERYLADTIDCALSQSLTDFELIICDDQSTDRSFDIAASYSDPRIRLLRNANNLGFGGNWNRCLEEARGAYIKILPQDDLLQSDCLLKQVEYLDADTAASVALVFCARTIIDDRGQPWMRRGAGARPRLHSGSHLARRTARLGTNPIGEPGAVMFRSTAARAAGAFNGERTFVIDIDYWLRLLKFGQAAYMPEALASFRVSRQSQSVRIIGRQASEFSEFLAQIRATGLYELSGTDITIGKCSAALNAGARALFYRLAMRRTSCP